MRQVQPSPNNQSKAALREWSGNSEHLGYRIELPKSQHSVQHGAVIFALLISSCGKSFKQGVAGSIPATSPTICPQINHLLQTFGSLFLCHGRTVVRIF